MTKIDLANAVQTCLGGSCSQREAVDLVEGTLGIIKETLSTGECVKLSSFGRFETRAKKPRMGRNPQTGEPILIESRRVVKFTPSEKLRKKMNDSSAG